MLRARGKGIFSLFSAPLPGHGRPPARSQVCRAPYLLLDYRDSHRMQKRADGQLSLEPGYPAVVGAESPAM